jgi:hypothetical protein
MKVVLRSSSLLFFLLNLLLGLPVHRKSQKVVMPATDPRSSLGDPR